TYRQYLERMIETLNLKDYIKMLGFISSTDLLHVYNAADVTVVPSYSEGSPLVIPESLACGTPVIATDVGGNAEYLSKVHLGELIVKIEEYDTSNTIYQQLVKCVESYKLYKKYVEPSKIPSWTNVATEYREIMRQ
ncbi:MAG: glycosyltransferase, partial [Ignisphaera sp.]